MCLPAHPLPPQTDLRRKAEPPIMVTSEDAAEFAANFRRWFELAGPSIAPILAAPR